jgi:uncharacterized protein DUF6789
VTDGQLLSKDRAALSSGSFVVALLAGFVASVAMVMAFAVAFGAALLLSGLAVPVLADWFRALTSNRLIDVAGPNLYAATAVFFVGGLIWALLFVLVFERRLRGSAWERGVLFSLIPWLFSLVVFMPLVGGGLLGLGIGAGPLPILGNLILHVVYGAVLGLVWGSAESVIDRPLRIAFGEDLQAGRLSEYGAARGLAVGLALGIVLGVAGAILLPGATGAQGIGLNPLAVIVAIGLTGAAFGSFVGSLSTS